MHLGTYARELSLGPRELTDTEAGYKVERRPLADAIDAATEGRFQLPAGPLALLLARRLIATG
ncbi:hypothetical protein [Streptomyces acidiscabies]|uniref:hypothetical protein n=1 Tax=Streptomyces acidiscabies TaxID=42234 RepID=UPI0038F5E113